jgi:hypothetical protein
MLPSAYLSLDRKEKALVIAFIQAKLEQEKKEAARAKVNRKNSYK